MLTKQLITIIIYLQFEQIGRAHH